MDRALPCGGRGRRFKSSWARYDMSHCLENWDYVRTSVTEVVAAINAEPVSSHHFRLPGTVEKRRSKLVRRDGRVDEGDRLEID